MEANPSPEEWEGDPGLRDQLLSQRLSCRYCEGCSKDCPSHGKAVRYNRTAIAHRYINWSFGTWAAGEIYLLVESDQRVHFRGHEEDPIMMWSLLEATHLSKKPGARFNVYDNLFSIRKQDEEFLVDLGTRIEKSMQAI